jgi:hypothetical protein
MNKKVLLIIVILFIAYYTSKANAGTQLTYRIGSVKQFKFAPFPTAIKFNVEVIAINPTSVSVNLQNADMQVFLSDSYIGRGTLQIGTSLLITNQNLAEHDLENEIYEETYFSGRLQNDLTRIQPNAETSFFVACTVQTTDLLFALGGVVADLKNKKIAARLKGTVKAELITINVDAPIVLQIPNF